MSVLTEFMISFYLYTLLCLTDFMGEFDIREYLALALVTSITLTVLVNLILLVKKTF